MLASASWPTMPASAGTPFSSTTMRTGVATEAASSPTTEATLAIRRVQGDFGSSGEEGWIVPKKGDMEAIVVHPRRDAAFAKIESDTGKVPPCP